MSDPVCYRPRKLGKSWWYRIKIMLYLIIKSITEFRFDCLSAAGLSRRKLWVLWVLRIKPQTLWNDCLCCRVELEKERVHTYMQGIARWGLRGAGMRAQGYVR